MPYVNVVFVQPSVGDAAEAAGAAEAVDRVVDQTAPEASNKPPAARTVRLDGVAGVMGMPIRPFQGSLFQGLAIHRIYPSEGA
jgi:hypothetical protein